MFSTLCSVLLSWSLTTTQESVGWLVLVFFFVYGGRFVCSDEKAD